MACGFRLREDSDLVEMSVPEISRDVALGQYSTIEWASFGRVGLLSPEDVETLRSAEEAPLDYSLGDASAARKYVGALLKVVSCVSDVAAQQYALTRIEDILLADDCGPLGARVAYFVGADGLEASSFLRTLTHTADASRAGQEPLGEITSVTSESCGRASPSEEDVADSQTEEE